MSIDQGIGTVSPAGIMVVNPEQTTTYTITATGSGGTTTASATIAVTNPISLQITEPLEGTFISEKTVSVRGAISHADWLETGLLVNGIPVIIAGDQFIANHVPLVQGENTITAMATDATGITRSDSITVNADIPKDYIRLTATPVSGALPFKTTLIVDGTFGFESSQLFCSGTGEAIVLDGSPDEYRVEILAEGVYTFSVEAADLEGNVYTDEVSVEVINRAVLDALLQKKWSRMKTALMAGDVEGALEYHHEDARERYAAIYNALGTDLPTLAGQMQDISWICYLNRIVKYRIRQNHEINGQIVTITYYICFSRSENGLWLIEKY